EGEAAIDDGGAYTAGMASATAVFQTPAGCAIPDIDIDTVTSVTVRATIPADQVNCQAYCAARVAGGEDQVACDAACSTDQASIEAEAELSAAQVAELSARNLSGGALGEVDADLTFDHLIDADGNVIAEGSAN
ncbi:MAG TPA: hypothetical protein VL172_17580, partial [Kofleriaceae bacterium]|nr:hypothetical protein [Kofleriaceae bacterium]